MAGKTPPSARRTTPRPVTAKKTQTPGAVARATPAAATEPAGARALVKAGLKALGEVRGDMLARQARIFELLLGIGQAPGWRASASEQAADPFGKFEDVFDQRVARALERLGMPSPQALQALAEQVQDLSSNSPQPQAPSKKEPKRRQR